MKDLVKKSFKNYPAQIILTFIFLGIIIGALILFLPFCRNEKIPFIDLFFTSTSLITSTGFFTIDLSKFSSLGHLIILIFMQIGGIGLITLTIFFFYLFSNIGIYGQFLIKEILSIDNLKDVKRILFFLIKFTFFIETLGAISIFFNIKNKYSFFEAIFLSIFHSVSSFCNNGASLFPNGMINFENNYYILIITTILIAFGGIGFIAWYEILQKIHKKEKKYVSWHSKVVIKIYFLTVIATAFLFFILERANFLKNLGITKIVMTSIFMAVSVKSTGFTIINLENLSTATLLIFCITMLIGSSPSSTGGGIKIIVFAIYLNTIRAVFSGEDVVNLSGRQISKNQIYKCFAIIGSVIFFILIALIFLLKLEEKFSFFKILFEIISSVSSAGMSLGIISFLTSFSKLILSMAMIFGRAIALIIILRMNQNQFSKKTLYPEEEVVLT